MTDQEFEQVVATVREKNEVENPVKEHGGWTFGDQVRVVEDDDDNGVFADDEGVLIIEQVGAVEYGSQRVMFSMLATGMGPVEVSPDNIEAA